MTQEKTPSSGGTRGAFQEGSATERLEVNLRTHRKNVAAIFPIVDRFGG
jgi:hypothetical protein